MDNSVFELTDVLAREGYAMGCCNGIVLGYWYVPFTAVRLHECSERYAAVTRRHGTFSVLTVFRVNPFSMDALLTRALRDETVRVLDAHASTMTSIVCVMEASPLIAAAMHLSAAATSRLTRASRALSFTGTFEAGLAQMAGVPAAVSEATLRAHMVTLEHAAAISAPAGVHRRAPRPSWARVD